MGEYVKDTKNMKYQSQEALERVQAVIDDADKALNDKSRRMEDSPIKEAVAGAIGLGASAGIGFAGLYLGGSVAAVSVGITSGLATAGGLVGGGFAAGLASLAAPVAIIGGIGIGFATHFRNKKLEELKNLVHMDAVAKQNALIKELKDERDADKERIEYLTGLNTLLEAAIVDLRHDLGIAG
ncbi:hypothetical protein [Abiotrophia sp. HMSC24B09]|uniref:hypothetical protein n=1 Tax=Abiotrophia sp. HMSC24B09 TaxID=1581061 RepID=UPI0025C01E79|nr:hypothetical protein [Abiotrophia sp. HMSC24B09]